MSEHEVMLVMDNYRIQNKLSTNVGEAWVLEYMKTLHSLLLRGILKHTQKCWRCHFLSRVSMQASRGGKGERTSHMESREKTMTTKSQLAVCCYGNSRNKALFEASFVSSSDAQR